MNKIFQKLGISLKPNPGFFVIIIKVIGVVMVWRGVWEILDVYFFPENRLLSDIISITLGLFILYLPDGEINNLI